MMRRRREEEGGAEDVPESRRKRIRWIDGK